MITQKQSKANADLGTALGLGKYNDRREAPNMPPSPSGLRIPLVPGVTDVPGQLGVGKFTK